MTSFPIRNLKAKDVRIVAGIIARNMDVVKSVAREPGEDDDSYRTRVGMQTFSALIRSAMDDVWSWLADLVGCTAAEFDELDAEAPLAIIEQLLQGESARGFFARASLLAAQLKAQGRDGSGTA